MRLCAYKQPNYFRRFPYYCMSIFLRVGLKLGSVNCKYELTSACGLWPVNIAQHSKLHVTKLQSINQQQCCYFGRGQNTALQHIFGSFLGHLSLYKSSNKYCNVVKILDALLIQNMTINVQNPYQQSDAKHAIFLVEQGNDLGSRKFMTSQRTRIFFHKLNFVGSYRRKKFPKKIALQQLL